MEWNRGWHKLSFGKKLKQLHLWNAIVILLLALSGILLQMGSIRGQLGAARVVLKDIHIYLGVVSVLLLLLYIPFVRKHVKQIRKRRSQRWNLGLVILIIVGWSVSGILLWQLRRIPPALGNQALFVHDLLSWIGIPYVIFHSLTRLRWVKGLNAARRTAEAPAIESGKDVVVVQPSRLQAKFDDFRANPPMSRRTFIRWVIGLALLIGVGPRFVRWFTAAAELDTGSALGQPAQQEANLMLPAPTPLPDSLPPIGGGRRGTFRIYTVTAFPESTAANWRFSIFGLVEESIGWTWEEFVQLKRQVQVSDFHCVTGWSVTQITWEGILLRDLLAMAKVDAKANFVKFYSGDFVYTDTLSMEQAYMDDVMVVLLMDGEPIPQKLGGPVRLIVPKMYTYKSVKWLKGIELLEEDDTGYWEQRGYSKDAWVPL